MKLVDIFGVVRDNVSIPLRIPIKREVTVASCVVAQGGVGFLFFGIALTYTSTLMLVLGLLCLVSICLWIPFRSPEDVLFSWQSRKTKEFFTLQRTNSAIISKDIVVLKDITGNSGIVEGLPEVSRYTGLSVRDIAEQINTFLEGYEQEEEFYQIEMERAEDKLRRTLARMKDGGSV